MSNQNIKLQCLDNNDELFVIDSVSGILNSHTGPSTNSSTGSMVLRGGLSITSTANATSSTSGGALTIRGGLAVAGNFFVSGAQGIDNVYYTNSTINSLVTNNINFGVASFFSGSATGLNNVSTPTDVTGLSFSNVNIRSFTANITINMNRSSGGNLFETFILEGIQNDSGWILLTTGQGDITSISFSITSSGQVQYTGTNMSNWVSTTFRYFVTQISTNGSYQTMLSSFTTGNLLFNNIQITDTTDAINGLSSGGFTTLGGASIEKGLVVKSTIDSTSKTEGGSLTVLGGASVAKNLIVGLNITTGALIAATSTIPNIVSTNISSGTLSAISGTIPNTVSTNISTGTLSATSSTVPNTVSTNISSGTLSATSGTVPNMVFTNISSATLNLSTGLTTGTLSATSGTVPNVVFTNISSGTLSATSGTIPNMVFINISSGTLSATSGTIPNTVSTNISTGTLSATTLVTTANLAALNVTVATLTASGNSNTIGSIITTGGNVGIGTIEPLQRLQVDGNILLQNYKDGFRESANKYIGVSSINGSVGVNGFTGIAIMTTTPSTIGGNVASSAYSQNMFFWNHRDGEGNTAATMVLTNNRLVGINTDSPAFTLDVNGTARFSTGLTTGTLTATSGTVPNMVSTNSSTGTLSATTLVTSANIAANLITAGTLLSTNITVGTSLIVSSGSICIGTPAPGVNVKLDVDVGAASEARVRISSSGNDSTLSLRNTKTGGREYWIGSSGSGAGVSAGNLYFYDNTAAALRMVLNSFGYLGIGGMVAPAYQLQLSSDSAAKPSTNTWTISSDERLKTNITQANLQMCYDIVKNIPLKRYTWLDEVYTPEQVPDRSKLGWIAQDVEAYLPKSVEQKEMHGYSDCRTLNSDQIIASMYGAIQKVITKLESEIEQHNLTKEKLNNLIDFIKIKYPSELN
jgi:hypothetical protein